MDLSDFSDSNFDPIKWINEKVDETNCTEQLMKLELLTSDLSNHLEDLTFKTIKTILPVELELGRLQNESLSLANTLSDLISQKVHKNESGLQVLIQMNDLKENMIVVRNGFQKIISLQGSIKGIEQYFAYVQTVKEKGDGFRGDDKSRFEFEEAVCTEIEKVEGYIDYFKQYLGRSVGSDESTSKVEMEFPAVENYKNIIESELFPRFHELMTNKKEYIQEAEISRSDELTSFKKIERLMNMFSKLGRVEHVLRMHIGLLLEEKSERIFKSSSSTPTDLTPIFNNLIHFIDSELSFYHIHLKFLIPFQQSILSSFLSLSNKNISNPTHFPPQARLPKIILQYRQTLGFLGSLKNRYGYDECDDTTHSPCAFLETLFEKYRSNYPLLEKKHMMSLIPVLTYSTSSKKKKKKKNVKVLEMNEEDFLGGKRWGLENIEEEYDELISILEESVSSIKNVCLGAMSRCREFTDGRSYKEVLKSMEKIFESMLGTARGKVREVMAKFLAPTKVGSSSSSSNSNSSSSCSPVSMMIKSLKLVRISRMFYDRVRRIEREIKKLLSKEKVRISEQYTNNNRQQEKEREMTKKKKMMVMVMDSQTKALVHYIRSLEEVNLPVFQRKEFLSFQKYCESVAMSVLFGEINDMFTLYLKRKYWKEEGRTNIREYIIRVGEHLNQLPELLADHLSNEDFGEEEEEEEDEDEEEQEVDDSSDEKERRVSLSSSSMGRKEVEKSLDNSRNINWLEDICEKCVQKLKSMILKIPVLKNDPSVQLSLEIEHLCSIMKILDQEKQTKVLNSIKVMLEQCSRETLQRKRSASSLDAKWLTEFTKIRSFH